MNITNVRTATASDSDLPVAPLPLTDPSPATAFDCGRNSERQQAGLPGHCEVCAQYGHVAAHPEFGCGDVGCTIDH